MNPATNIYAGKELASYGFPGGHPFSTLRFDAFWNAFVSRKLDKHPSIHLCPASIANATSIELFHTSEYVDRVKQQSQSGQGYLDFGDTPAYKGVYEAAAYVVGTVLDAVEALMTNSCQYAFVPIAGLHHAMRDQASGFCVFNDCGIAIEYLIKQHNLNRIAYIDIDAHHGDGVFYSFESNPKLIYADIHEDGKFLFPGTGSINECGTKQGKGYKLNIPMPEFADDDLFFEKFDLVLNFVDEYEPEFVILQCGVDSIKNDPLTHLHYSPKSHYHATSKLRQLVDKCGHNRLLCLGGGGYNLENIANGWCSVVEALVAD